MDRYVVRIADGEFGAGGGPGAVLPVTDATRYTVVVTNAGGSVTSAAFSPDGTRVVTVSSVLSERVLDAHTVTGSWNETTRETVLKNYNQRDMFI